MYRYNCILLFLLIPFIGYNQSTKDSTLTLNDLETVFLANNYQLLAAKYNVAKAEAEKLQAKLWQNPTLTLSQVNLWSNKSIQLQPYLIGHFGNKQEFAFDLEQVIETAGKRAKRVNVKETEEQLSQLDFEVLMRELRVQLRSSFYELEKINELEDQLNTFVDYYTHLSTFYKHQADLQNIAKAQYFRIQTELLDNKQQLINLKVQEADALQNLRILTQIPTLKLSDLRFDTVFNTNLSARIPANIMQISKDSSISKKYIQLQLIRSEQLIKLEKANAKPDIHILANYDRGGSIMTDFVGFGIGIDLPIFNRNQGKIKIAQLELEQNKLQSNTLDITLETQISKLEEQLKQYEGLLKGFPPSSFDDFKIIMDNYSRHLQDRQVSLIEMIDYAQSYLQAKQKYYEILENYQVTFEQLQILIGKDL